ncbi:MAG: DUF6938 domain-containing protein [Candidatus Woesearchaeota archaeon]
MIKNKKIEAWIIAVDMGYGHQRAAYPLKDIAYERIITANSDKIISEKERNIWEKTRSLYEAVSRLKNIPILGQLIFKTYDQIQKISPFFPFKDYSMPNFSTIKLQRIINNGFGRSLVEYTSKKNIPVITTYSVAAMMYEYNNKKVYLVVTDTDISRAWVSNNPKTSNITYFAPCKHVVLRLKQYGISEEKIIETGFPLPKENIGKNDEIVKQDLVARLVNLDPGGVFFEKYKGLLIEKLGFKKNQKFNTESLAKFKTHNLTLTYAIGGAGAQKELALDIIKSLRQKIESKELVLNIIVGIKLELKMFFEKEIKNIGMQASIGAGINIVFALDKKTLFETTNKILRTTDILWTKPSEMSFYTALGIPIIIAPPIGSHEIFNKEWLEHIGSGFVQENPKFTKEWLYYWMQEGRFADAAIQGFIDAPRHGIYNIEKYLSEKENI